MLTSALALLWVIHAPHLAATSSVHVCSANENFIGETTYRRMPGGTRSGRPVTIKAGQETLIQKSLWEKSRLWQSGSTLRIGFIGGDEEQREFVKTVSAEWIRHANLTFEYIGDDNLEAADITIGLDNSGRSWSYVGTGARHIPKGERTMNFGWPLVGAEGRRTVLHEFGHMLGLQHEHQHPGLNLTWRVAKIAEDLGWTEEDVQLNIVKRYEGAETLPFNRDSIMIYGIRSDWNEEGVSIEWGRILSSGDKQWAEVCYPGKNIEEAPVNRNAQWIMKDKYIGKVADQHWWNWSLHIEGEGLKEIEKVVYYLHPSFSPSTWTTTDRQNKFQLATKGYGTFLIRADVYWRGLPEPSRSEFPLQFYDPIKP